MGSGLIEVDDIGFEKPSELLLMQDEEVIQTFSPHSSGENVHRQHWPGARSIRSSQHIDATCGRHACEIQTEFPVNIPNQVFGCLSIRSRLPQRYVLPKDR
jgi:hypothetical protein